MWILFQIGKFKKFQAGKNHRKSVLYMNLINLSIHTDNIGYLFMILLKNGTKVHSTLWDLLLIYQTSKKPNNFINVYKTSTSHKFNNKQIK